jgi:hypothetical protein
MKTVEIVFFGVAVLLPLVGGSTLLYFLSRGQKSQKKQEKDE